jgi:hypothetical protein
MDWFNLISILLGGGGIVSGILALYNAKSNRDTVDISNFHSLIEEERKEREIIRHEFLEYKREVNQRVAQFKDEFNAKCEENSRMQTAIYQAYRCRWPDDIGDCPVIDAFRRTHCPHYNKQSDETK